MWVYVGSIMRTRALQHSSSIPPFQFSKLPRRVPFRCPHDRLTDFAGFRCGDRRRNDILPSVLPVRRGVVNAREADVEPTSNNKRKGRQR